MRSIPLHGVLPEPALPPRFALASKGFRPFFFGAAVYAALIVPLWLLVLSGIVAPGRYLEPVAWHAHEMIFGYATAVIAGFLLTAVSNWTQRETVVGAPLLALAALWALGRGAMLFAGRLPAGLTASIDLAFLPMVGVAIGRPLVASRNRRNFVMLAILGVLTAANTAVHLEALGMAGPGTARHAMRVAIDVIVLLMLVIAGRIVPMFTRNATKQATASILWLDRLTAASAVILIALDLTDSRLANTAAGALAIISTARALRWGTQHTLRQPLLWILHAGYFWIPIGLMMRAFSMPNAMHALTVGAIGGLTMGMMARVALGHTGRKLEPAKLAVVAFLAITAAALARVYGELFLAGGLWALSFLLYLVTYTPILFSFPPSASSPAPLRAKP